jgi:hypothetical protein
MTDSENTTSQVITKGIVVMTPFPIKDLIIHSGKRTFTYQPKKDISTYELALLIVMFPFFNSSSIVGYDYEKYIFDNKLERHFEVNNEPR